MQKPVQDSTTTMWLRWAWAPDSCSGGSALHAVSRAPRQKLTKLCPQLCTLVTMKGILINSVLPFTFCFP